MSEAIITKLDDWRERPVENTLASEDVVEYRIHANGGGRVASTAIVGAGVYVGPQAIVRGRAIAVGCVRLFGRSILDEDAIVADYCTLRDNAQVGGHAVLRGFVTLRHDAVVDGNAFIAGSVQLQHFAHVSTGTLFGSLAVS